MLLSKIIAASFYAISVAARAMSPKRDGVVDIFYRFLGGRAAQFVCAEDDVYSFFTSNPLGKTACAMLFNSPAAVTTAVATITE
jgi:hypothetical protein